MLHAPQLQRDAIEHRQKCSPLNQSRAPKYTIGVRAGPLKRPFRRSVIYSCLVGASSSPLRDLSVQCQREEIPEETTEEGVWMKAWDSICVLSDTLSKKFAWVVLISCSIALVYPAPFIGFGHDMISLALALSMLAMGCTLKVEDFAILAQHPFRIGLGILLQYTIMPLSGFSIAKLVQLPSALAAGVILVSCCPGGVASNVVTYLAGGDVAISVAMTSISTLLAIGLTPLLTSCLIGTLVPVDGWAIFKSTLQVILLPLVAGLTVKSLFPKTIQELQKIAPLIAIVAVTCINVSITACNSAMLLKSGLTILVSIAALHITGFSLGYLLAAAMKLPIKSCITISIEVGLPAGTHGLSRDAQVGMQNSGLGAVLAMKHFGDPLTTCACVVSACFHSVVGGLLASLARHLLPSTLTQQ